MAVQPTIIFDLDGTLADTIRDLVPSLNRTIATCGLPPVRAQEVGHVSGKGIKPMIQLAFDRNKRSLAPVLLDELFDYYMDDYAKNIAVNTVLFPGAHESIEVFSSKGWLLGVCTNKPIELADDLLRQLGVDENFASVTGGDSFDFRKPDPRHLIHTIEMAGGKPSMALMVGDSQNDILTAQNAGIPSVAVDFGYSEHPVASYGPHRVISSFDILYETAAELIAV